jgi:hypothetical protein
MVSPRDGSLMANATVAGLPHYNSAAHHVFSHKFLAKLYMFD